MSEATLDSDIRFPSYMVDWYRERSFMVAFALSVLIHAVLIAFVPGFRSVPVEAPRVLEVEIMPQQAPLPRVQERPVVQRKIVEPPPEPVVAQPQPVVPQPQPVLSQPQPVVQPPQPVQVKQPPPPEPPPVPRADIIRAPQVEPKPEFVVPKPELRPQPRTEPRLEATAEPRIEPRPEPPPVARVEPRPQPRPAPAIEPRPEPRLEPRNAVQPEVRPAPQVVAPVAQARVEPSVAPTPPVAVRPVPAPVAAVPAPPLAAPQPAPAAVAKSADINESKLLVTYGQSISKEIRRYQKYPPPAQRRGWQGTAEVLLQIAADGKVTGITLGKSSGYAILDEEALDMVRRASPLPAAPPDLRGRALVVTVPIVFRLQS
jgi:protein TonB